MPWHVIAQIGGDSYYPALDTEALRFVAAIDKPGDKQGVTHDLGHLPHAEGVAASDHASAEACRRDRMSK